MIGINEEGNIKYNFQDFSENTYAPITNVREYNGQLYSGSLDRMGIAKIKRP